MYNYNYGYNPYTAYNNAQQRLNQLEMLYPQYTQNQQQNAQQTAPAISAVFVTSIDEANASRVDLSGMPTIFYNAGKNEIYVKKFNPQTGGADFIKYAPSECPQTNVKDEKGINTYSEDFKALNGKIDGLKQTLDKYLNIPIVQATPNEQESETIKVKGGKNAK